MMTLILSQLEADKIQEFNNRFICIATNSEFSRKIRSMSESIHFKAKEWIDLLLFYAPPSFQGILQPALLEHFCTFSSTMYVLLKDNISMAEIQACQDQLNHFVKNYEILYGKENMNSIVHQLLHMPNQVREYGPMWLYSAFTFENENNHLLSLIRNWKDVLAQISKRINLEISLNNALSKEDINKSVKEYCVSLRRKKESANLNHCTINNKNIKINTHDQSFVQFKTDEILKIHSHELLILQPSIWYKQLPKIIVDGVLFKTKECKDCTKTNDTYVQLNDNSFGQIYKILLYDNNVFFFIEILQAIKPRNIILPSHIFTFDVLKTDKVKVFCLREVHKKCIFINNSQNILYLCAQPCDILYVD